MQKSLLKHGMADKGMRQKIRKRNAESDIEHNMKEQDKYRGARQNNTEVQQSEHELKAAKARSFKQTYRVR